MGRITVDDSPYSVDTGFLRLTRIPPRVVFEPTGLAGRAFQFLIGHMIMFQEKASELYRAPMVPASGHQLAPNERPAPLEILSTAKRAALIACLKGGGALHKRYGVWVPEAAAADDKPVAGITVADLSRDGMLTVTVLGKSASAQLTARGSWFARTAAAEIEFAPRR
jgi:hypothetical protein